MTAFVYTVEVFDRDDSVYVFAEEQDAAAFEDAVNAAAGCTDLSWGSACIRREQVVCNPQDAAALIAAERDAARSADVRTFVVFNTEAGEVT